MLFFSESSRKSSTIVALRDGDRLFGTAAEATVCRFPFYFMYQYQSLQKCWKDAIKLKVEKQLIGLQLYFFSHKPILGCESAKEGLLVLDSNHW